MTKIPVCMMDKIVCGYHFPCHCTKRIIFVTVFVALFFLTGVAGAYSGGDGSADSPYQISHGDDLITLSEDSENWDEYFIVTNDIDLAGGRPTSPIGNSNIQFTGNFDGQGHTISEFTIDMSGSDNVGLFGSIGPGAEIRNLGVSAGDAGVHGHANVGVFAGYNDGSITNCYATGDVNPYPDYVIDINGSIITNCSVTGSAFANDEIDLSNENAGGLVGYNGGSISNCSAAGSVTGILDDAGGLVGYNGGSISNCSATGDASADHDYAGGLVGYNGGTIITCYATGCVIASKGAGGLVGYNDGNLMNCLSTGSVVGFWGQYIGGLVGHNDGGTITNCSATGASDAGNDYAGGLVGFNDGGTITNCSATGAATANFDNVGGLVGYNSGIITACYATGNATTSSNNCGGLVGNNGGTISTCYATGNAATSSNNCGGLVGYNGGTISTCYATGCVIASKEAGGLVGVNLFGTITNCYATGNATASSGEEYAGGLVGYHQYGTLINCYRHYTGGGNSEGTYVSDLTTFRDIAFLTGNEPDNGLNWATDIISTDADSSKVWRVFTYKGQYPIFQWQAFDTGSVTVTSSPSGADISLNGVATGRATDAVVPDLVEGEYNVTVEKDGYKPASSTAMVTSGTSKTVDFTLIPDGSGPVAAFTGTPLSGYAPLTVTFTDQTNGTPTAWFWEFGDNATSEDQHPTHIYTTSGNYTVSLSVNGGADTCTRPGYITVMSVLYGDANNDGTVNQVDTLHVLKEVVGLSVPPSVGSKLFVQADVNKNDMIDVADAMFIAQYNVGLRDALFRLITT